LVSDDTQVSPASTENYASALAPSAKSFLDRLFSAELSQGTISIQYTRTLRLNALGTVPKKDSTDLRPITDCSRPLNNSINDLIRPNLPRFRLPSVDDVTQNLPPNSYLALVDIKAAYHAVPVFPPHRQFLGFQWAFGDAPTAFFVDNCLSFGLSNAPLIFFRISKSVFRIMLRLRAEGLVSFISITVYLDDFCVVARTIEDCAKT
jgi:hypothetical protein